MTVGRAALSCENEDFWVSPVRLGAISIPRVSVVIPVFNGAATLGRAMASALNQSVNDIEVIVVDDASTDSTWPLIAGALDSDPRTRAIRHWTNRGKPVAMNRAIHLARGHWLAVLDADDWYHADRLTALIDLGDRRRADMVADNQFLYDAMADRMVGSAWPGKDDAWELSFDDFLIGADARENFNLGMLKPVTRVDFLREMRPAYEEEARLGEDFLHLLRFYLRGGRAVISDIPYYYYTQPFGTFSRQWSRPSRERYDFQNAWTITERHAEQAAAVLTRRQRLLLAKRNHRMRVLEQYFRAKAAASSRNWGTAMALLTRHPEMLNCLLRQIRNRIRHRPASRLIDKIASRSRRPDLIGEPPQSGDPNA